MNKLKCVLKLPKAKDAYRVCNIYWIYERKVTLTEKMCTIIELQLN